MGIKQYALLMIFPYDERKQYWNACILHHPLQEQDMNAKDRLKELFPNVEIEQYKVEYIKGVKLEECESGFYMALYSVVSHKCKSLEEFKQAIESLEIEQDLCPKTREWFCQLMTKKRKYDYIPQWIQQLTTVY